MMAPFQVLHPSHHLMLDLKYPLVHLYNTSEPLPARQLDRKEQLCRQILSVADVLTPGELSWRPKLPAAGIPYSRQTANLNPKHFSGCRWGGKASTLSIEASKG